jgi:hypothetical protein
MGFLRSSGFAGRVPEIFNPDLRLFSNGCFFSQPTQTNLRISIEKNLSGPEGVETPGFLRKSAVFGGVQRLEENLRLAEAGTGRGRRIRQD